MSMVEAGTMDQSDGPRPASSNNTEPRKAIDPRRVLACGTCRKRKLKCDSKRPKCSTCARLGHTCEYDEVRKKSGPKRGYVKELEARLKQVETLLTTQPDTDIAPTQQPLPTPPVNGMDIFNVTTSTGQPSSMQQEAEMVDPGLSIGNDFGLGGIDNFNWDMISLGLEEPLPSQDIMDELYEIYFTKAHPSMPIIHKPRFLASLNMSYHLRPPICLRYIMWAHACALTPKYKTSAELFYQKARKYIEQDEMKGHGESFISVQHGQTWNLIVTYEFKMMYFPRAWMSCGRATRIVQLMGFHRQDRVGLDVKQTVAPPKDWIEREERRRTFWLSYCQDRYASVGTGWPLMIDERDILTNLPASEEAFITGRAEPTPMLSDVMAGQGCSGLSAFSGVCLLATVFGRNLTHLHRPTEDDNDHDLNGEFWKRHRGLDNIVLNTSLSLPGHLRLPYGLSDPNIIFTNMSIHSCAICLHQAAIFKADKHNLHTQISADSKRRCIVAADQITNIMKMCSHLDLAQLHPFVAFCLYVAARVFVQYLKSKRDDSAVRASLMFLLSAMNALRLLNPLTESFIVQLDVDLEGSGLNIPSPLGPNRHANRPPGEYPPNTDAVKCAVIYEVRESQSVGQPARESDSNGINGHQGFCGIGSDFLSGYQSPNGVMHLESKSGTSNSDSPGPLPVAGAYAPKYDYVFGISKTSPGGSGSQSDHPTPSGSSAHNSGTSNTSFSPDTLPFSDRARRKPSEGAFLPGLLASQPASASAAVNMNENNYFANSYHSTQRHGSTEQDTSTMNNNLNRTNSYNDIGNIVKGNDLSSGFTGQSSQFTSEPTGFTPVPSGFTPGPSSGMGTGLTPMNWDDLQIDDNNRWMFDQ